MQFTIGADPELFVRSKSGAFISGHDLIPGTKTDPYKVAFGAIQVDGVALEFNIDPAKSVDEFINNLASVQKSLHKAMIGSGERTGLSLAAVPVAHFTKTYFDSLPAVAKELGCEPDWSAYTGLPNPKPATTRPMRTGAGHIHIGWGSDIDVNSPEHKLMCERVVKQLDVCLFLPSCLWDPDDERRSLYGMPGSYRPKSYGVEYRPLSNAWLRSEDLQRYVYAQTMFALDLLADKKTEVFEEHPLSSLTPYEAVELCTELGGPAFPWADSSADVDPDFWTSKR